MARGIEGNEIATPKPPTLRKTTSSQKSDPRQRSMLSFFSKGNSTPANKPSPSNGFVNRVTSTKINDITPAPSSDVISPPSSSAPEVPATGKNKENGLHSLQ